MAKRGSKKKVKKYSTNTTKPANEVQRKGTVTPSTSSAKPNNTKRTLILTFSVIAIFLLTFIYEAVTFNNTGNQSGISNDTPTEQGTTTNTTTTNNEVDVQKTHTVSVALNLYTIPDKNEVEVVLKNTSTEKATYNLSSSNLYSYKILDESNKLVKQGAFGKIGADTKVLTLAENEEYRATLDYDKNYNELKEGYYTLEVVVNSKNLKGSKASTSFNVSTFDKSVSAIVNGDIIIREIDSETNSLKAIVNGLTLVNFKYTDDLKTKIEKLKVSEDIYRATYITEKGVTTLQTLEKASTP